MYYVAAGYLPKTLARAPISAAGMGVTSALMAGPGATPEQTRQAFERGALMGTGMAALPSGGREKPSEKIGRIQTPDEVLADPDANARLQRRIDRSNYISLTNSRDALLQEMLGRKPTPADRAKYGEDLTDHAGQLSMDALQCAVRDDDVTKITLVIGGSGTGKQHWVESQPSDASHVFVESHLEDRHIPVLLNALTRASEDGKAVDIVALRRDAGRRVTRARSIVISRRAR